MPKTQHISARPGDVLVMVGTMKGMFVLHSNAARKSWDVGGPYSVGSPVYAAALDTRQGRNRLWWAQQSFRWGTILRSSDDFGKTSTEPETYSIKFPEQSGWKLKNIWQICVGSADQPDKIYCGVEPSALFESNDGGKTWSLVRGLFDHPHREKWTPGGGGQCLHTILPHAVDRKKMIVAMSTGGAYSTNDGGANWQPRNVGIRAEFFPDKYPEFGQCVHKIGMHPSQPDRLYLQNHWGLYRSDDFGASWKDVANGVPSDFGFCLAVHPHNADTAYIVPIESDEYRCTPEGKLRVYQTRSGGKNWQALTRGLPQKDALETVLRDGLSTDTLDPAGIYFGTRSGKVYGSNDEGKSWQLLHEGLPSVVCVKAAVVAGRDGKGRSSSASALGKKAKPAASKTKRSGKKK